MIPAAPRVLSVEHLTAYLRALIEEDPILNDVWVRGEVTNFHRSAAGHCYFSLSNDGSQLRGVLFRNSQRGLLALPSNGDMVLAHGKVSIYEGAGQYQLIVDNIAPEGTGVLQLQFEEMRRRLEAEGLFSVERKRPLPDSPKVIGVVTSAQGAVWHDICTVIERRWPLTELVLAPSAVQGTGAPVELIRSLNALQQDPSVEVIIIGRGGGSAEDLACFNDEQLARAIFASSLPIVSAVGHETDVSISDLVADLRAPTPSAAAELCVPDRREVLGGVVRQVVGAEATLRRQIDSARHQMQVFSSTLSRCSPASMIQSTRQKLDLMGQRSSERVIRELEVRRRAIDSHRRTALLLDPRDVLRRGYALVSTTDDGAGVRLNTASDARQRDSIHVMFADGSVSARVEKESS
jgi:exodeoxyribonuclease VII large subunit